MSQVLAAKTAPDAAVPARPTAPRPWAGEPFAAVLERTRKPPRTQRQGRGGAERSASERQTDRASGSRGRDKPARAKSQDAHSATWPGREEQCGHPAAGAAARPEDGNNESGDPVAKNTPAPQNQAAETPARPEDPQQAMAGPDGRPQSQNAQELMQNEAEQRHNEQASFIPNTQGGRTLDEATAASAQAGVTHGSGERAPAGTAGLPRGSSVYVPGGPVSVPAETGGSAHRSGAVGSQAEGPWGPQVAAAMVSTLATEAGPVAAGKTSKTKAKSAAGAGLQEKASGTGGDFQTIVAQRARSRQPASLGRPASPPGGARVDSAQQPIQVNGPAGAEELARVVRAQVGSRHSAMTIQLDLPELGRVRVDVKMHDDVLTLRFQTQTEAGHNALQGRLHELTGALEGQGIRLDRVDVEYRPPPDGRQEGQSLPQHGGQQSGQPRYAGDGAQSEPRRERGFDPSPAISLPPGLLGRAELSAASGVDVVI